MFSGLPKDVRLAAFAAAAVLVAAAYEFSPIVAALLGIAMAGAVVAFIVGRD